MKGKFFYIYYFVMMLVLALSINRSIASSAVFRLGYLAALFLPLLNKTAFVPAILLVSLCLVRNTFAPILVPTEMVYYVLLSLFFCVQCLARQKKKAKIKPLFLIILVYVAISDLVFSRGSSLLTTASFLLILLYVCAEVDIETSAKSVSLVFLMLSLILSYWKVFAPESQLTVYNSIGDMEQVGWLDPNYFSCALGAGVVLAVSKLLQADKTKLYIAVLIVTIIFSAITLLGLASRGVMLAISVSVMLMMFFSKATRRIKLLTTIALALFVFFLYTNQYMDFLVARFQLDDGTGGSRTTIWADKLYAFITKGNAINWLFGFGQRADEKLGMEMASHNDFISVLLFYGVVGLVLLIGAISYPIRICSKSVRPQVVALLSYLVMCSMSIDPLVKGNVAYLSFFFYIILFAHRSRLSSELVQIQNDNIRLKKV